MSKKISPIIIGLSLIFLNFPVFASDDLTISNIEVPTSEIRPTTATVTWDTDFPSNSDVHYWSVDGTHNNHN